MSPTTFTMKTDSIINLTNNAIIDKFYGARKKKEPYIRSDLIVTKIEITNLDKLKL